MGQNVPIAGEMLVYSNMWILMLSTSPGLPDAFPFHQCEHLPPPPPPQVMECYL